MGYKRAGCDVVAACDIDPEMAYHYKLNLKPKHYFLCPVKDLVTMPLPEELFGLDILDGSPPCSTFSMAGSREKAWGKEKHFREGQSKQVLSDLFFDYLDVVERLKPKVAIAENVKGMILGNAKGYTKMVMQRFKDIGYRQQLFLLNAADCGVPQKRERVFFCAARDDLERGTLVISPNLSWVSSSSAVSDIDCLSKEEQKDTAATQEARLFWHITKPGSSFAAAKLKKTGKANGFGRVRIDGSCPCSTLTSNAGDFYHWGQCRKLTYREWKRLGSFPDDYKAKTDKIGKYMIGMSVPPKMTEVVARSVCEQWLGVDYGQSNPGEA